ncbi:MAG: aldo/keto reductase [Chlamydiota bacterium]
MLKMPLIGLGTWKLYDEECEKTVNTALDLGYRHIDTADEYKNHKAIGKAIKSFPREDLYLTTKVAVHDLLPSQVNEAVPRFLKELQTDYIDLLLIHWPNPDVDLVKTLEAMLLFQKQGLVKSIGISNFVRFHLEMLEPHQFPILTNQIELHPYLQRKALVALCKKMGITVTAYRPLAKGAFEKDPTLQKIGKLHGKSASQVALRWLIQQDIAAIPKAATLRHMKDNLDIFDFSLSESEMLQIEKLDQGKRFCSPEGMPIFED